MCHQSRRNAVPVHRAELRLVVHAGSALEDEYQRSVAQFLGHTTFNGATPFEEHDHNYVEHEGMRFGVHVKACMSVDGTVYVLSVPTDRPQYLLRSDPVALHSALHTVRYAVLCHM